MGSPIEGKPKMAGDERHARRLVQIMKDAGTAAGEIMMFGALEAVWLKPDDADHEGLLAGLQYAGDQGWVEDVGAAIRLTAEGASHEGSNRYWRKSAHFGRVSVRPLSPNERLWNDRSWRKAAVHTQTVSRLLIGAGARRRSVR